MRHRLIHGYVDVRLDMVWAVVKHRPPELLRALEPILPPGVPAAARLNTNLYWA
jgi:uncharacterized protein with HEPN domain